MMPQPSTEGQVRVEQFQRKHRTGLVTLLFTDLVDSVALRRKLGDQAGTSLLQAHRQLVRELLQHVPEAEEIETAGDSFLLLFARPSDAVRFALLVQRQVRVLAQERDVPLADRIGIHVGEVVIEEHQRGPKPKDLYGAQIDLCARVMGLAEGRQILLTRAVFDSARQALKGEELPGLNELQWLSHGPYLFQGIEEPVDVCEVGEVGAGILRAPEGSEKARRQVSPESEPVLGWRPAVGQWVPNTRWQLERKLGEGGFGEVWLGKNPTTKELRVFKFCFHAERVRFLKRELTLFRLMKERVGLHPNIVRLHDIILDQPPFYVEMDYVEGADLRSWSEDREGIKAISLETRLERVAQAAEGLQAAHEAGIIHRDIKPANILISHVKSQNQNPKLEVKLTDFGIGQVVSEEYLNGITRAGFTQTMAGASSSSGTGTQLYMAPELLAGKPASTRSDIYSLGVVLYQSLVGDFTRPVTTDWARQITDPLLREDLGRCFAGDPNERFGSAAELAKNPRALPERRAALERQQAELAAREKAAYRRGILRTAGLAAVIITLVTGLAIVALHQSRKAEATAQREREQRQRAEKEESDARRPLYVAKLNLAQQAWEQNNIGLLRQLLEETKQYRDRGFEWFYWQRQTHQALKTLQGHLRRVISAAFSPDGQRIVTVGETAKVWDAASGRELLMHKGNGVAIGPVFFSSDGQRIVSGVGDNTAKVWEAASGRELVTLTGHDPIWPVAFSPDGQRIATVSGLGTSGEGTAKVWEAVNGHELFTLKGHGARIYPVVFSPDSQRIVTGSADNTAKLWDATIGREPITLTDHTCGGSSHSLGRIIFCRISEYITRWNGGPRFETSTQTMG